MLMGKLRFCLAYVLSVFSVSAVSASVHHANELMQNTTEDSQPYSEIRITGDDISDEGKGSSYLMHTFSLNVKDENITDYEWKFYLKDKEGGFELISQSTSDSFVTDEISSVANYFVNADCELEGRIECECNTNGVRVRVEPLEVFLDLKPSIISIDDLRVDRAQYDFSVSFNVRYVGASRVCVYVEEKYDTVVRSYRFDEPLIAHVKTGKMSSLDYSWVTIVVRNDHGEVTETLEFEPTDYSSIGSIDFEEEKEDGQMQLIDLSGNVVYDGPVSAFCANGFKSGVYIKRYVTRSGNVKAVKIFLP